MSFKFFCKRHIFFIALLFNLFHISMNRFSLVKIAFIAKNRLLTIPISREFATKFGRKTIKKVIVKTKSPTPAEKSIDDSWVSVKDETSGQIYWWNQITNETTALGEPKPTGPSAVQSYTGPPPPVSSSGGGGVSGRG